MQNTKQNKLKKQTFITDAIESSEELEKELNSGKLLRRDVKSIVERFTLFLGIISGGVTVGKHVIKHKGVGNESECSKHSEYTEDTKV